jgi:general secretion pathway protein K
MEFDFPSGHATVDVIPETSKMNVNTSTPEDIYRVLTLLGADPGRAREIVLAILDWRTPVAAGDLTSFDQQYLGRNPSFHSRHASFEEIEELLLMKGMTPELFYGAYERGPQGRLVPHHGVRDCLSVYGSTTQFDVNTADPAVLAAAGLTPEAVSAVVQRRSVEPFLKPEELSAFGQDMPGFNRLRVGGNMMYTVRATARPRLPDGKLSDARRTVAVLVKFLDPSKFTEPYHVLRWYENVWVQ